METNNIRKTGLQIVSVYLFVQLLTALFSQLLPASIQPMGTIWSQILLFISGAGLIIYLNKKHPFNLSFEKPLYEQKISALVWGVIGLILVFVLQFVALQIEVRFLGAPVNSQNTLSLLAIIERYPYFVVVTALAGPIMEEFVFRKVLFGLTLDKIGGIGAAVISSLGFALIYLDGSLLFYASMGLVFSWLYYKSKNIWTPVLVHCLMNSIIILQSL